MEKNNGDNKEFGLMRMIIVFLSVIIILLIVLIIVMFNKNNEPSKVNNDNDTKQVEKEKTNDEEEERNEEVHEYSGEDLLTFADNLKMDNELKEFVKEITIDLGDRKNPLFDTEIRENSGSFVELALYMLPVSSRHTYKDGESVPSAGEVGIDWSAEYDPVNGYIDAKVLREKYEEVFGGELVNSNYRACPYMLYSSKYDRYYYVFNCGGTGYLFYKYVYDYKVENDLYLVYVAYESAMGTEDALGPNNYNRAQKFELAFEKINSRYVFSYSKSIN